MKQRTSIRRGRVCGPRRSLTAPATPSAGQKPAADPVPELSDEVLAVLLPKGEGRETVKRVCATECHSAERVAASAGTRDYWETIVQDMTLQGAVFTGEEQEEIVGYLAAQYPPKLDLNRLSVELLVSRLKFSPEEAAAIVYVSNGQWPVHVDRDAAESAWCGPRKDSTPSADNSHSESADGAVAGQAVLRTGRGAAEPRH